MKKAKSAKADEMRAEYARADFPGGFVRGKYAARIAKGSNIVVLAPEVAAAFPTTEAVNEALLSLIRVAVEPFTAGKTNRTREPIQRSRGRGDRQIQVTNDGKGEARH